MKFKDVAALIFGSTILIILVPVLMYTAALLLPYGNILPSFRWSLSLGTLSCACGLFFMLWSNYELWVKGRGGAAVIGKLKLMRETSVLVTTGPYAICRNPMHLGLILYYLGCACTYNSLVCMAFPLLAGVCAWLLAVYIDEPRLRRDFADDYAVYCAAVPRFFPKLKRLIKSYKNFY